MISTTELLNSAAAALNAQKKAVLAELFKKHDANRNGIAERFSEIDEWLSRTQRRARERGRGRRRQQRQLGWPGCWPASGPDRGQLATRLPTPAGGRAAGSGSVTTLRPSRACNTIWQTGIGKSPACWRLWQLVLKKETP
eukprot:SAG22_NODE_12409_length_443_cov_2.093023_1_plen_139_part_10